MDKHNAELEKWQAKVRKAKVDMKLTRDRITEREKIFKGEQTIKPITDAQEEAWKGGKEKAKHVFNIVAENIESEIDVNIPQPKVTAVRPEDEYLAKQIEDFIRSELDRQPFEEMNDLQERIVPVQGGSFWQVGWDNTKRTHTTVGELFTEVQHPKRVIPQHGVYSSVEEMDFIALEIPKTKEDIKRKYGVDVSDLSEEEPDVKSTDDEAPTDMVTQVVVYFRNEDGGIGRYSYVGDTELENIKHWNARQRRRCAKCGAPEEAAANHMGVPTLNGTYPGTELAGVEIPDDGTYTEVPKKKKRMDECPYCGGRKWEMATDDYRTIDVDYITATGKVLPAKIEKTDELGNITYEDVKYPYYKVDLYPIIIQRNISVYGELLGESDVDKIEDQQNTMNNINKVIIDRIFEAGTIIGLPRDVDIETDPKNGRIVRFDGPEQAGQIKTYDFTGDISEHMAFRSAIYEEPRQILGITDSLQGRRDSTATSAVAKEFAATQSAGRLESKRRLKNAAYARIFELMFKTALANMDEPRPIRRKENGETVYAMFDPMEFYELDAAGEWYVNDRFLFSTDSAAPLASNREAMWREITTQYSSGSYGDPNSDETRLLYWSQMEELHYPLAAFVKKAISDRVKQQQEIVKAQLEALKNRTATQPMTPAGAPAAMPSGMPAQGDVNGGGMPL
ncbi:MAG: hypothetical protein IJ017_04565 [Oscillospiraceae bacterium]|nr:hypothetical protein [Oscillospiraceae bacterium]